MLQYFWPHTVHIILFFDTFEVFRLKFRPRLDYTCNVWSMDSSYF